MKNKQRGQLFMIEVFIAVGIMLLLTVAIYRLELTQRSESPIDLSKDVEIVLHNLHEDGILQICATDQNITHVGQAIEDALGPIVFVKITLRFLNDTTWEALTTYNNGSVPLEKSNVDSITYATNGIHSDSKFYEYTVLIWTLEG